MIASPIYLSIVPRVVENDFGQRRQKLVDEMGELVRGQPLGDRGEIAHVAEHQRELALLAAELELAVHRP